MNWYYNFFGKNITINSLKKKKLKRQNRTEQNTEADDPERKISPLAQ